MSRRIVAIRKNGQGRITQVKLDDGREMLVCDACKLIGTGELQGYVSAWSRENSLYIRAKGDQEKENNLARLPIF